MKRSQQATLFQTWGYRNKEQCITLGKEKVLNSKLDKNIINLDDLDDENIFTEIDDLENFHQKEKEISEKPRQVNVISLDHKNKNKTLAHEKIDGFDEHFGSNYIYPTNYPVRDYQFNIIKKSLFENCLVVLPTGLGKTFIAAVVMYNYYRWYPQRKLIFMAPTKPLVAQQINACYDIMGIPVDDTAEMTGAMSPTKREWLWKEKRVFFMTPQVLQNDLARGSCIPRDIVCLVFDEAHRALGSHAYSQVIKEIHGYHSKYRVLALSATPGDDMKAIQQVIDNLLISHIEIRSEESVDIQKYVHDRTIEKIVVPFSGEIAEARKTFLEVLQSIVGRLHAKQILWTNDAEKVSKYMLLKTRESWRAKNPFLEQMAAGSVEGDFALLMSLYHAYDVLLQHGLLSFFTFLKGVLSGRKGTSRTKTELQQNANLMDLMESLHSRIEPDDRNQSLNESIIAEKNMDPKQRLLKSIPKPMKDFISHPKISTLEEIVVKHFQKHQRNVEGAHSSQTPLNTRVMIFSQFRDSVQEITAVLSRHEPLVKCMSFIGQGSKETCNNKSTKGLSQKEQIEILRQFREGSYNTVVSTSVGEEGLDIGEVDLIICFDASSSPIRLVQRMGRTGRKRDGKIVVLVGEGKEAATYEKSLLNKKSIHKKLTNASKSLELFDEAPRLIPGHLNPTCYKMNIVVDKRKDNLRNKETVKKSSSTSTSTKKSSNIKQFLGKGFLTSEEQEEYNERFRYSLECLECKKLQETLKKCSHRLTRWSPWQTSCQTFSTISHSTKTKMFCSLMETGDLFNDSNKVKEYEKKLKKTRNLTSRSKVKARPQITGKDFRRKMNEGKIRVISEDSDSDIEHKKERTSLFSKEPCSREGIKQIERASNDVFNKKVRLTRLPKVPKIEVDVSVIEDNQIGFCSQQTMPTLFDRCQMKRKRESLSTLEEKSEDEDGDEMNEEKRLKLDANHSSSNEDIFTSIFPRDDQENADQFLPITSRMSTKTSSKETKMVEKETIPEPPSDLDLSSFNFETQLNSNKSEKLEVEKMEEKIEDFEMMGDSLMELFDDADKEFFNDLPPSPPIVSQLNQKQQDNRHDHKKEDKELVEEDSPVFVKKIKKKNRNVIWETQHTPTSSRKYDDFDDDFEDDFTSPKGFPNSEKSVKATKERPTIVCPFIEYEAEDDDARGLETTGDYSVVNGYVKDSFINDDTVWDEDVDTTACSGTTPVDMRVIYKQSLMSHQKDVLNFHTPAFKANMNRFKLANLSVKNLNENSEAEEVLGPVNSDEERLLFDNEDEERLLFNNEEEETLRRRVKPGKRANSKKKAETQKNWFQLYQEDTLPEISFRFGIVWERKTTDVCPLIVIDTKCLANSQIASNLRFKEKCTVVARQRIGCDYIVSRRTGVIRRFLSEISNSSSNSKISGALKTLCNLYERCILIIEKDRAKKNSNNNIIVTKYYANMLSKLCLSNIRILHSGNQVETSSILGELARREMERGHVISQPKIQNKQFLETLFCIPHMTYPVAMEITKRYVGFGAIMKTSLMEWNATLSFLPERVSSDFFFFFQKKFKLSMTPSKKL